MWVFGMLSSVIANVLYTGMRTGFRGCVLTLMGLRYVLLAGIVHLGFVFLTSFEEEQSFLCILEAGEIIVCQNPTIDCNFTQDILVTDLRVK